ncbi:MAG TPA: hypothetical protein VEW26_00355 [Allosphingosinicella sp.]|nr:hypothetical protein [Allosphingosinicella sp.]
MKKLILVSAAGLLLATANTPPSTSVDVGHGGELDSVVAAETPKGDYHPAAKPAKPAKVAVAPEAAAYPPCSATVRDRCVQGGSGHARATHARRIQLAMRAGERG